MTLENNPFEVTGLERLVDLDKAGGFIGRDALVRIMSEGVRRKLVGVRISGHPLPMELSAPWPVVDAGRTVGRVTDAVYSPRLEANIGYAWVPIELARVGTELGVEPPGPAQTAVVTTLPFLDPKKKIPAA